MNWAYVHLAVNHLPVLFVPVGLVMLAAARVRKSDEFRTAGFAWLIVAALAAGGAYLTGEPAEDVVETLPGVSDEAIEAHEDSALIAAVVTGVAGVLAFGALATSRGRGRPAPWMVAATVVVALLAAALMARAANLGGHIRHPEIRGPASAAVPPA